MGRLTSGVSIRDRFLGLMDLPIALPAALPVALAKTHLVSFQIAGGSFFIRSRQSDLNISSEGLGSAFLLPAAAIGRRISGAIADQQWQDGAGHILGKVFDWWGWRAGYPHFRASSLSERANGVGLAFSLGVDSFYSLFFADTAPDFLVLAAGYDVPLERPEVLEAMCRSVAEIAEAVGAEWALIETDLRKHCLFRKASWECTHGGAVAMLGHLLSDRCGTFLISSSFELGKLGPWGSHPDLDPLWSSSALAIRHFGEDVSRLEKLRRLINHPVARKYVQRHLRVCWVAPNESGNCGRCRKCTLLRASLDVCEPGFQVETMPNNLALFDAIRALAPCSDELVLNYWRELLGEGNFQLDAAIRDLVNRSEVALGIANKIL